MTTSLILLAGMVTLAGVVAVVAALLPAPPRLQPAPGRPAGLDGRLESGALERSNVSPVLEMTRLMDVNRSYALVTSMISRMDELRGSAISKLANVA